MNPYEFEKFSIETPHGVIVIMPNGKGTFNVDCDHLEIRGIQHKASCTYEQKFGMFELAGSLYLTKHFLLDPTDAARRKALEIIDEVVRGWLKTDEAHEAMRIASIRQAERAVISADSKFRKLRSELDAASEEVISARQELRRRGGTPHA
jgi:hypothetical protein